jgi:hypothetical protein
MVCCVSFSLYECHCGSISPFPRSLLARFVRGA